MITVVGIRFKPNGKIYYFSPEELTLSPGDKVVVNTARGEELGTVVLGPREVEESEIVAPLKPVERKAEELDVYNHEANALEAKRALQICAERAVFHGLEMNIIDAEFTLDRKKLLLYFTAEGRIDFRQLVRDLAAEYRTRIELRQVGVRDEAKIVGGLGSCGRPVCCKMHLDEFCPVHIKMAKDQNLSLNPTKISGLCGRLMCCLTYEYENYAQLIDYLPNIGEIVETPNGSGPVISLQIIKELVMVRLPGPQGDFVLEEFNIKDIAKTGRYDRSFAKKGMDETIE